MYKIILPLFFFVSACTTNNTQRKNTKIQTKVKHTTAVKIDISLINTGALYIGNTIKFKGNSNQKTEADSIIVTHNNKQNTYYSNNIVWNSAKASTGTQTLRFTFYWGDSIQQNINKTITLLSDITPQKYTYEIIETWPHNTKAYTQGLEFSNDVLYEGTGENGKSMLRKIDLNTNQVIESINLPTEFFGEGITILNDKIYQITWKSNVGFVYNKKNLQKLYDFNYPTDGWGLTNNGTELIMSDGSEKIYFLDTEYFSEVKRLEVYDNVGPVTNLNELELIGNLVYANIYGTNNIIAFDVNTGKVMKYINLSGILDRKDIKSRVDVLNGIAWYKEKKQLIVTGKWWPKLYHIKLIETN